HAGQGDRRARGLHHLRLRAHAEPARRGSDLVGHGVESRGGEGGRPPLRAGTALPPHAVRAHRAEPEAPRLPDAARARGLLEARHPPVRARRPGGAGPGARARVMSGKDARRAAEAGDARRAAEAVDVAEVWNRNIGGWDTAMGLRLVSATRDEVVAEYVVDERHRQPYGIVHGGMHCGAVETVCSTGAA